MQVLYTFSKLGLSSLKADSSRPQFVSEINCFLFLFKGDVIKRKDIIKAKKQGGFVTTVDATHLSER